MLKKSVSYCYVDPNWLHRVALAFRWQITLSTNMTTLNLFQLPSVAAIFCACIPCRVSKTGDWWRALHGRTWSYDHTNPIQGLCSLSGKTSCRQIPWNLEAARLDVRIITSHWNLTGISTALLPRWLSNFSAIGNVKTRISRLRDFTRSCGKTSVRLVNRGPWWYSIFIYIVKSYHMNWLTICLYNIWLSKKHQSIIHTNVNLSSS